MNIFIFILLTIILALSSSSSPDLVIELSRHGARGPLNGTYDLHNYWNESLGELTGIGMRMSFILGAAYKEDYPELLASYDPTTIYVRATDANRTIMGANSKLFGVYNGTGPGLGESYPSELAFPPFNDTIAEQISKELSNSYAIPCNFQPVPVHVVEMQYDTLLLGSTTACPESQEWFLRNSQSLEIENVYNDLLLDVVNHLQSQNLSIHGFSDLHTFADLAIANKYEHMPIPGNIEPDSSFYEDLKFAYEWYTTKLQTNLYIQKQLNALNFLFNVVDLMNGTLNGTSNLKFGLFSGHDSSILSILSAFNIVDKDCLLENYLATKSRKQISKSFCVFPAFGSNLKFELFKAPEAYIKFFYNDVPVKICENEIECTFVDFKDLILKVTNGYSVQDYKTICNTKKESKVVVSSSNSSKTTVIVLAALTGFLLVGLCVLCYYKNKNGTDSNKKDVYRNQI